MLLSSVGSKLNRRLTIRNVPMMHSFDVDTDIQPSVNSTDTYEILGLDTIRIK